MLVASAGSRFLESMLFGCRRAIRGRTPTSRFLGSLLFGIAPHDPATFLAATLVLVVSTLAAVVPVRRATAVSPVALRLE